MSVPKRFPFAKLMEVLPLPFGIFLQLANLLRKSFKIYTI